MTTPPHTSTTARRLAIIGVPSSAGARRSGQEDAPLALRAAGLVGSLERRAAVVRDRGDVAGAAFRPDRDHPRCQNLELVSRIARSVAAEVEATVREGEFPVVLGGDCSITVGVLAGLLARPFPVGLLYVDGDLDLNTPETTPSGIYDGMVVAHLLGSGSPELAGVGSRTPLLEAAHLAFFGYNEADGGIDSPEIDLLARSSALRYPVGDVRHDPRTAARTALAALAERAEHFLVHFDIDVTDTPAVDVPHPHGLSWDDAFSALEIFLASPRCIGMVCTELNPRLDPTGGETRNLADRLSRLLAPTGSEAS